MKSSYLLTVLLLVLIFGDVLAQRTLQENHLNKPTPRRPMQVDQTQDIILFRTQQVPSNDPFRTSPLQLAKKRPQKGEEPKGFPSSEESQQIWETYKPFDYEEKKKVRGQSEGYYAEFNELLKWGMIAGSFFLVFVLIKTCTKKNGRRQMRRLRQQTLQRGRINPTQQQMGYYYAQAPQPHPEPIIVNINQDQVQEQQQQNIDEKIINAERELNKLKSMKQDAMRQQFNRKKMEEEQQRKVQMINVQRRQAFEQSRRPQNNWNVGYGPVFYGQQQQNQGVYVQGQQQPFVVKGIEPIRQRSNSFKTETSERPILNNEVNYRNGIPVGKPIKQQDNDSSFASEYPEV